MKQIDKGEIIVAKTPTTPTTSPQTSMMCEVWMSELETATGAEQLFYVQEIGQLFSPNEPVTFSSLENDEEMQAKGMKKAQESTMTILYSEAQTEKLYELAAASTEKWWFVKYPESTAADAKKPLVIKFKADIAMANDAISIGSMLQDTLTWYFKSNKTRMKGMPTTTV